MDTSAIHVTSRSRFGLSNRIRGLAGYYALSKLLPCQLFYTWESDPSCPGNIEEVFDNFPAGQPVESFPIDSDALLIGTSATPEQPTHCGSPPDKTFHCHGAGKIDQSKFNEIVGDFYQRLQPVIAIKSRVNRFYSAFAPNGTPTLGIHIRRTDMVDHRQRLGMRPLRNDRLLIEGREFLREYPEGCIFLASDNPFSVAQVKLELGRRVYSLNHKWITKNLNDSKDSMIQARLTTLQDSVCDLWMLSHCDRIIGTHESSFSQLASRIRNKPLLEV